MDAVFILLLFVLVLSIFLGIELISKVPSILHTPLMSGANAISGITIVGAILSSRAENIESLLSLAWLLFFLRQLMSLGGTWLPIEC